MSIVAQEAIDYIRGRKEHSVVSLRTRWNKLNSQCMGGIEPNTVYTFTGISGTGKSSLANLIATDIIDLNPSEDIVILNFSLEMVGLGRSEGRSQTSLRERLLTCIVLKRTWTTKPSLVSYQ